MVRKRESILNCHSECSEESSLSQSVVGGSPTPNHFLLSVQKKVIKEKYTPCQGLRLPCATHQVGRLRNSPLQASQIKACSELKQSSPKTPNLIVLLGMAAGDSFGAMSFSYCAPCTGHSSNVIKIDATNWWSLE